ncbi:protein FAM13C isoform X2 [Hippocampus comes]|uniref:protein FAM13C isoform X2 n=1 Tax=Hippocampus comes TaxID=109280 RepID=UPI00094E8F77|nr:PREDICTED: protein FAM13C isoform X2 [Hippocampus comes]
MFCFCFQSPSLKLQALEADFSPPGLEQEDPPEQKNLPAHQQPLLSGQQPSPRFQHEPLLHSPPTTPAQDTIDSSRRTPSQDSWCTPAASGASPPEGAPGSGDPPASSPGGPPLLSLSAFTTGECPVPSPRCPNLSGSLRYNLDPDAAPSPPCSQHLRMARCSVRAEAADCSLSVSVLKRHVQTLRRRIRQLEEHFEQERLKPSCYDKTAHPEVARLIKELLKSRKQLKELKLCQAAEGVSKAAFDPAALEKGRPPGEAAQLRQVNNNSNAKPSVEETLHVIGTTLTERRRELRLPDAIQEMNRSQMSLEKSSLQKSLLYFESLHGRPSSVSERSLVRPLYERYRLLKELLLSSATPTLITTIEEEEGSDDDHPKEQNPRQQSVPFEGPLPPPTLEASDTPLVSPLEEVECLQPQIVTMATLHEASRLELLDHLRVTRLEKRRLHRALREFEELFYTLSGRVCQKEDRGPMAEEYCQYKNLKAKLRLLEALLSKKQDTAKSN